MDFLHDDFPTAKIASVLAHSSPTSEAAAAESPEAVWPPLRFNTRLGIDVASYDRLVVNVHHILFVRTPHDQVAATFAGVAYGVSPSPKLSFALRP